MLSMTAAHWLAVGLSALSAACFSHAIASFVSAKKPVSTSKNAALAALRRKLAMRGAASSVAQANAGRNGLSARLEACQSPLSARGFVAASIAAGVVAALALSMTGQTMKIALFGGGLSGVMIPRAALSFAIKRHKKAFRDKFAAALDTVVRAAQAGMPLNRCLQIAAGDGAGPVNSHVARLAAELAACGSAVAFHRFARDAPIPEARFFAFALQLQQETGGSLKGALGALSGMLRTRDKFRARVATLTAEARMSAIIIGALPVAVAAALAVASPDYLSPLWTHPVGRLCFWGALVWMSTGIAAMHFLTKNAGD